MFDALWEQHPHTQLIAMGEAVGLPAGQMGNSEVGHLNLGAGAVVPQDLARIDAAVEDGSLADNESLRAAVRDAPRVHLIGLVSDGGVHSADRHLQALLELVAEWGVEDVVVHAFTDGRDTLPTSGAGSWPSSRRSAAPRQRPRRHGHRPLLRDGPRRALGPHRAAYDLLVHGRGDHDVDSGEAAVRAAYERDETDEFITPTTVGGEAAIRPDDAVIGVQLPPRPHARDHARAGRAGLREIDRGGAPPVERYATMTEYDEDWDVPGALPAGAPGDDAAAGHRRARASRSCTSPRREKYPHVTYFFDGGEEDPYPGEERELTPSPRDVPTYDHKPEMSAREATEDVRARLERRRATRSRSSTSPTPTWSATPA